jgi:hypothetical protein
VKNYHLVTRTIEVPRFVETEQDGESFALDPEAVKVVEERIAAFLASNQLILDALAIRRAQRACGETGECPENDAAFSLMSAIDKGRLPEVVDQLVDGL